MSQNKFTACSPPICKCPTIEFVGTERLLIKDDFLGEVTLTTTQFEMMTDWYKSLSSDPYDQIVPTKPVFPKGTYFRDDDVPDVLKPATTLNENGERLDLPFNKSGAL